MTADSVTTAPDQLGPNDVHIGDHVVSRNRPGGDTYIVDRVSTYVIQVAGVDARELRVRSVRTGSQHVKTTANVVVVHRVGEGYL